MNIDKIWNRIINLGNSRSYDLSEQARIRLINKLGFVTLLIIAVIFMMRLIVSPASISGSINSFVFVLTTIYLNAIRKHFLSRIFICFVFPLISAFIVMKEGSPQAELIVFLLNIVLAFILFEENKKLRNICVLWITSLAGYSFLYIVNNFDVNPIASNLWGTVFTFNGTLILLCYMFSFYQSELKDNRAVKDQLLESLKQKNIELERFTYISSHDLKEPAKTIIAFSDLTASYLKQGKYEEAGEFIQIINKSGRRMNQLIEDTLEFTSYDQTTAALEPVDLGNVLQNVKSLLKKKLIAKKATIVSYQNLPTILGQEKHLISCFENIIENGITYNESKNPVVEVDCKLEMNEYIITFKDNGAGIKKEYFDKIFRMYERLVNQEQNNGSGLGLAISKKVIERIGGRIWLTSEVGKGSTFFVAVPYNAAVAKMVAGKGVEIVNQ